MTTSARPQPGATRDYHFPRFERQTLDNGLRLVVAPVRKLPLATVLMLVDAGAVCEPEGQEGVAQLTAKLLLEGTATSSGVELTERFERLGASTSASADWDVAVVQMTVLTSRLRDAFTLFGEVLRTPSFPEREVDRLKSERLTDLLQLRTEPRGLAEDMFSRFTYAPGSRYAKPEGGSEHSVRAITRGDVLAFYGARYRPGAMTLIVVGDVDPGQARALAETTFASLAPGTPPVRSTEEHAARSTRAVHIVAKDDAPQSELRIGHVGLPRSAPDYFPVVVMNAILGGLFSSRINLNLREVHGYTYGARSDFEWRRQAGPFVVSTAVKSDVTDAAAREVLQEIDRMRAEPVSPDELSLATSYLGGVFPIRYETTAAIAAALANLIIYALPEDFFDRYRTEIRGVTAQEVLAAAERHLHPEQLQIVVVGDPDVVRAPLERLRLGPVTTYDVSGSALV